MSTVWRVFKYLRRYPVLGLAMLFCAIVGTLMVVVFPAVTKLVIDQVLIQQRPERLAPLLLVATLALRFPTRPQLAAHHFKQHLRAEGDLRSAERSLFAYPAAAAALV